MTVWAVFLRGMNVGGRRVTNQELCAPLSAAGFSDVGAFLASGNVVLATRDASEDVVRERVEGTLSAALGYAVPTFVRAADELARIAAHEPFGEIDAKVQVALVREEPESAARLAVLDHATADDRLAWHDRELFWAPARGVSGSELDWRAIERLVGPVTVRTHRTLVRMAARLS